MLDCTVLHINFVCPTARIWGKTSSGADPMAERSTGLARGPNHVCHAARSMHAGMPALSRPATMVGPYRWRATRPEKVDTLFGDHAGATVTSIALLQRRYSSRSAIRSCHPRPQQGSGVGCSRLILAGRGLGEQASTCRYYRVVSCDVLRIVALPRRLVALQTGCRANLHTDIILFRDWPNKSSTAFAPPLVPH